MKEYLEKLITAKKAKIADVREKIKNSNSVDEVRSLGDELDSISAEIREAQAQLDALEAAEKKPEEGRSFNPRSTYNSNRIYTFKGVSEQGLALRSDETMASRVNGNPLNIGKYVRGAVTGNWNDALEEREAFNTSNIGVLIPTHCSAQVIDIARAVSMFAGAGVPVIPMENGNLTISKVKKDAEFLFKPEGQEQTEGNGFELESLQLKAKTAYGYAYVSLEAINFADAVNLSNTINMVFSRAMANCIDNALLYGQATNKDAAPAGIMNDSKINTLTATNEGYGDFVRAIGAVRRANGNPTVLGINAETEEIMSLKVDKNGQPLMAPKSVEDLRKVISNQLKADAAAGSDALVFDPMAMVIGMQNRITFNIFTDSDYCIKNGMVGFRIYAMIDSAVIRPEHITKISGIGLSA